jgi:hypothetical protein
MWKLTLGVTIFLYSMGTIDVANIYARINIGKNTINLSFRIQFLKTKKYKLNIHTKPHFHGKTKLVHKDIKIFPSQLKQNIKHLKKDNQQS